MPLYRRVVYKA